MFSWGPCHLPFPPVPLYRFHIPGDANKPSQDFIWTCFILSCSDLGGVSLSAQESLMLLTPESQFDREQLSWISGIAEALIPQISCSPPFPVHYHNEGHPCAEMHLLILLTETQIWSQFSKKIN